MPQENGNKHRDNGQNKNFQPVFPCGVMKINRCFTADLKIVNSNISKDLLQYNKSDSIHMGHDTILAW